jgi:hypothetical protein
LRTVTVLLVAAAAPPTVRASSSRTTADLPMATLRVANDSVSADRRGARR